MLLDSIWEGINFVKPLPNPISHLYMEMKYA